MRALMVKTMEELGESLEGEVESVTVNSQVDKLSYNFNKDLTSRFSALREVFFSGTMSYTVSATAVSTLTGAHNSESNGSTVRLHHSTRGYSEYNSRPARLKSAG